LPQVFDLYLWLARRFPIEFVSVTEAQAAARRTQELIQEGLTRMGDAAVALGRQRAESMARATQQRTKKHPTHSQAGSAERVLSPYLQRMLAEADEYDDAGENESRGNDSGGSDAGRARTRSTAVLRHAIAARGGRRGGVGPPGRGFTERAKASCVLSRDEGSHELGLVFDEERGGRGGRAGEPVRRCATKAASEQPRAKRSRKYRQQAKQAEALVYRAAMTGKLRSLHADAAWQDLIDRITERGAKFKHGSANFKDGVALRGGSVRRGRSEGTGAPERSRQKH
jgi:hypothetical protein